MCIPGITRSHKPGSATQIGILCVVLQRAISLALPEGQQPIECDLLDRAIVCIRGTGTTVTDNRAGVCSARSGGKEIAAEVIHAVINRECLFVARSPLETGRTCSSMHH